MVKMVISAIDCVMSFLMERGISMVLNPIIPYITAASIQHGLPVSILTFRGLMRSYLERNRAKSLL